MPADSEGQKKRTEQVRTGFARRNESLAKQFRGRLGEWYSETEAGNVKHAEAFEICEYGGQPNKTELKRLFPFFEK